MLSPDWAIARISLQLVQSRKPDWVIAQTRLGNGANQTEQYRKSDWSCAHRRFSQAANKIMSNILRKRNTEDIENCNMCLKYDDSHTYVL